MTSRRTRSTRTGPRTSTPCSCPHSRVRLHLPVRTCRLGAGAVQLWEHAAWQTPGAQACCACTHAAAVVAARWLASSWRRALQPQRPTRNLCSCAICCARPLRTPTPAMQAACPRSGATSSPPSTSSTLPPPLPWTLARWHARPTCRCGLSASGWSQWWLSGQLMRVAHQASSTQQGLGRCGLPGTVAMLQP